MNISRILCVDDDAPMQAALKTGLGMHGFEVITASHGIDALVQYKALAGDFGTIVTANEMPQMDGLEFVRSVRKIGFKGRIVVIFGDLKPEHLRAYQDYAISGFFHKPFEVGLLAAMLLQ
jgi:CheY-like chemotaxis protein